MGPSGHYARGNAEKAPVLLHLLVSNPPYWRCPEASPGRTDSWAALRAKVQLISIFSGNTGHASAASGSSDFLGFKQEMSEKLQQRKNHPAAVNC